MNLIIGRVVGRDSVEQRFYKRPVSHVIFVDPPSHCHAAQIWKVVSGDGIVTGWRRRIPDSAYSH